DPAAHRGAAVHAADAEAAAPRGRGRTLDRRGHPAAPAAPPRAADGRGADRRAVPARPHARRCRTPHRRAADHALPDPRLVAGDHGRSDGRAADRWAHSQPHGARRDVSVTESAPIRLLLVDDQELFLQGLSMILESQDGLEVVGTALDGEQAIARTRELRPDVVLMDIRMPVLDGVSATAAIRREAPAPPPHVIVLT